MCLRCDGPNVEQFEGGISGRLEKYQLRASGQQSVQLIQFAAKNQIGLDPQQRQLARQQFQRSAVSITDANDALTPMRQEQSRLGGHPRTKRPGHLRAFKAGERFFNGKDLWVQAVARIETSRFAAVNDIEQVCCRFERKGGGVVHRKVRTAMRVLETVAVNGTSGQALLAAFSHLSLLVILTAVSNGTMPNSGVSERDYFVAIDDPFRQRRHGGFFGTLEIRLVLVNAAARHAGSAHLDGHATADERLQHQ